MAQTTVTHFVERSSEEITNWASEVGRAIGLTLYDREPEPGDVTVRTLTLDLRGSCSDAHTELHVEIAADDWPKDNNGRWLDRERASAIHKSRGNRIIQLLNSSFPDDDVNVWLTGYPASGWSVSKRGKLVE